MTTPNQLPETRPLSAILPKGREGGLEFARIVDLLLFHDARRHGRTITLFSDRAGDYHGLDSFADGGLRVEGRTGFQYKFYPSPLSDQHRQEIKDALYWILNWNTGAIASCKPYFYKPRRCACFTTRSCCPKAQAAAASKSIASALLFAAV